MDATLPSRNPRARYSQNGNINPVLQFSHPLSPHVASDVGPFPESRPRCRAALQQVHRTLGRSTSHECLFNLATVLPLVARCRGSIIRGPRATPTWWKNAAVVHFCGESKKGWGNSPAFLAPSGETKPRQRKNERGIYQTLQGAKERGIRVPLVRKWETARNRTWLFSNQP